MKAGVALAAGAALAAALVAAAEPARAAEAVENPHGSFQGECATCHAPDGWKPARIGPGFDHSRYGYELTGAHESTPCLLCHLTLEFNTVAGTDCAQCHQDVHAGELGNECERCHNTRSFIDRTDAVRNHRMTRFPLTGAHATVDCDACHGGGTGAAGASMHFANTPVDCASCHMDQFRSTKNPDHVASGFPTDCAQCHSTFGFGAGAFDHAVTGFPLTGAHKTLECAACHANNVFTGATAQCVSCHLADYQAASNPPHVASGFPTDCVACHGTTTWQGAAFDHDATAFPLTGAHRATSCVDCHGDGVYQGKDPACVACHLADYQAATNPNHVASGFGTDCASCHGTNGWSGATFNHDALFFPIYSGAHAGTWGSDCTICHVQPADYAVFECILCHTHNQTQMDSRHVGVQGYSYDSNACYTCHPRGHH